MISINERAKERLRAIKLIFPYVVLHSSFFLLGPELGLESQIYSNR